MAEGFFTSKTTSGSHKIFYQTWGDPKDRPLVCVHGLTGSSQDFKYVGEFLANHGVYTVALDVPGRGRSDFLANPEDYKFEQYFNDIKAFISFLKLTKFDWLGVSMGGLLGIHIAGEENSPIERLILSDVGPEVPKGALDFIAGYLTLAPVFSSITDVVNALKQSKGTPFYRGDMNEEQWVHYASTHVKKTEAGLWSRAFDPKIAYNFATQPLGQDDLWAYWKHIVQPTLLLHGQLSILMTTDIAQRMAKTKPGAPMDLETIIGAGHVPSLYPDEQIKLVKSWLDKTAVA